MLWKFVLNAARAAALLVAALSGAACAGIDRRREVADFADGRYAAARAAAETRLATGDAPEDAALDRNLAGTAALLQGDVQAAHRHFREAFDDLEDLTATTGETALAMAGPERTKRWKGDPHERCMNAYYLGVTYWLLGDPDNAAAAFKAGLLRDADSAEGAARSDFAALWYLLGMAQRAASHEDRGEQAFAKARELLPKTPWTAPEVTRDANLLVVVDVGLGPRKTPEGPHGAAVRFTRRAYATAAADVSVAGKSLGRTASAADVFVQAVTRGGKTMDDVNLGKAVVKDAAIVTGAVMAGNARSDRSQAVGLGLILAGLLLPAEADVRGWETLPGEIHVLAAKLPPGEHRLRVQPQDESGRASGPARDFDVTVRDGAVTFVWTRAAPAAR